MWEVLLVMVWEMSSSSAPMGLPERGRRRDTAWRLSPMMERGVVIGTVSSSLSAWSSATWLFWVGDLSVMVIGGEATIRAACLIFSS